MPADSLPSPPTERVVRVLEHFASRPVEPIGLAELARALELNKGTLHLILGTLVALGWLDRDDTTKSYALGPGLAAVARAAETGYPAVSDAAAELAELAARHALPMALAAVLDDEVRALDAVVPPTAADRTVHSGLSVPFAPPFGAVFAAWGPTWRTARWLDRAPAGSVAAHEASLRAVLDRGFAVEQLNQTSRRVRDALAHLAAYEGGREAQRALLPLMAELSGGGASEQLPAGDEPIPLDVVTVPVRDRHGHAAFSITAQVAGPITRAALDRLVVDLHAAASRIAAGGTRSATPS